MYLMFQQNLDQKPFLTECVIIVLNLNAYFIVVFLGGFLVIMSFYLKDISSVKCVSRGNWYFSYKLLAADLLNSSIDFICD